MADMKASLDFYRRVGVEIPPDADSEGYVEVTLLGGLRLAWDTVDPLVRPAWEAPSGSPGAGLAFLGGSPAEVDALYAELVAGGAEGHKQAWDAD